MTAPTAPTATSAARESAAPAKMGIRFPQVEFPEDPGLRDLPRLFDPAWVWQTGGPATDHPHMEPDRMGIRHFIHSPGRSAMVSYEVEWHPEDCLPPRQIVVRTVKDRPVEVHVYPADSRLPGLVQAADPELAVRLVNRHVLFVPARSARVETIRYRPGFRAVLRYKVGRNRFYARVMRPDSVGVFLSAHALTGQSGFVVPRLAGCWEGGGVVWLSEIPGRNLRRHLRKGRRMDPDRLLEGLERLWRAPVARRDAPSFKLAGAYRRARRAFRHNLRDSASAMRVLNDATGRLDPFVRSWRPTGIAHNDFYDDQMLVLRDGRVALVDFEEAGPGDPLLDVGNFLAHLRWSSRFGRAADAAAAETFHGLFREAVLERFRWSEDDLAPREAVCLFRTCTNAIRHPGQDWRGKLGAGLALVNETLG